jgi:hypothetical protein
MALPETSRLIASALLLLFGTSALYAATPSTPAPPSAGRGAALLDAAVAGFFNETSTHAQVRGLLEESLAALEPVVDTADRLYWQARVSYLFGIVERGDRDTRAAEARFSTSLQWALQSIQARASSDAYRLVADDYAQLMLVNGVLYAITTGRKIKVYAEKSLALDPANAKAQLILALYALNAPGFAGGSERAGHDALLALRARADLETEDRFAVAMWLAIVSGKRKDRAAAGGFLSEARLVYPGSSWIHDIEKEIAEGS